MVDEPFAGSGMMAKYKSGCPMQLEANIGRTP